MSLIEVQGVSHHFADGTIALRRITLAIADGDLLLLAGRNGSGKTVLMKHLNGLLRATEGRILLEGRPIEEDLPGTRRKVGLVFQDPDAQLVGQTVREEVAFGPENLRLPEEEVERRVEAALSAVGLSALADHAPRRLSGGEKRRLAVAGVLAMEPRLIIFDEPFSGLDYPGVRQVLREILRLHGGGHTIVVITHEIEKILGHATRLVIMDGGCIVGDGRPAELLDRLEDHGIRRPAVNGQGVAGVTWLR